jgi:hypothetical protein
LVGRLTQGHKQSLGFTHATMLYERRQGGHPLTLHLCVPKHSTRVVMLMNRIAEPAEKPAALNSH